MADGGQGQGIGRYFYNSDYGTTRLLWCTAIGVGAVFLVPGRFPWRVRALAGWDTGVLLLLGVDWKRILTADARTTARRAAFEDVGRVLVWLIVIGAALFSLFSAIVVLKEARTYPTGERELWSALALLGVALAWGLTHTAYALRYAHLHYGSAHLGGFDFPGDRPPTEVDFAYVSFTVAMTFATSDVGVTSRTVRRTVLGHSIVSFIYNLTILALAIELAFAWLRT
jgi:uncharacterized membrane protein